MARPLDTFEVWNVDQFADAVRRYYGGESLRAIAAATGINRETLRGAMERRGIERRPCSTRTQRPVGTVTPKGYRKFWMDGKRKGEHRIVAENVLQRELSADEDVHHRNGKKADNAPDNLAVAPHTEHSRTHARERWARRKR